MSKKSLSPKCFDQATAFLFTGNVLFFTKCKIFTWFEGTGDMALAMAHVIDLDGWPSSTWRLLMFVARGNCLWCPLIICFFKKLISGYPAIMSLDSAIKDDIVICRFNHDFVLMVTCNFLFLQDFACHREQIHTCLGAKLHGPKSLDPFSSINLSNIDTKPAFFHSWHVPRASLNLLADVDDIK